MVQALCMPGGATKRALVGALADCVRMVLPFTQTGETRPHAAITTVSHWAKGYAVPPDYLRTAARRAREAVWDADTRDTKAEVSAADYVATAAATLAELAAARGAVVSRRALSVAAEIVLAQTEAACAGLTDEARAAMAARAAEVMDGVLATILRVHFPAAPATWAI
jgi:hypothetical protein